MPEKEGVSLCVQSFKFPLCGNLVVLLDKFKIENKTQCKTPLLSRGFPCPFKLFLKIVVGENFCFNRERLVLPFKVDAGCRADEQRDAAEPYKNYADFCRKTEAAG